MTMPTDHLPAYQFDNPATDPIVVFARDCAICGRPSKLVMSLASYEAWRGGSHVQAVWPDVSKEVREVAISGTHPDCWRAMFGDGEAGGEL